MGVINATHSWALGAKEEGAYEAYWNIGQQYTYIITKINAGGFIEYKQGSGVDEATAIAAFEADWTGRAALTYVHYCELNLI